MRRVFVVLVGVALALPCALLAQPRLGDELVASPLVWRAFRPLVRALGDGDRERAVAYMRAGDALLRKADGPIERDAPTREFQTKALASIGDFDLKEFFALLPLRDGPYHMFAVEGAPREQGYRFVVGKGKAFEVEAHGARRGFGDSSGVVRMRHLEQNDKFHYLLESRGGVGVGALTWPSIADGFHDVVAMVDERADIKALPLLLQTADSHLKRSQPALQQEDRRVLAQAWGSFPEVSKLLTSISLVDDVVESVRPDGISKLRLITRWDMTRMARDYPHLAAYLRRFGTLCQGKLRLVDAQGLTVAEVAFDTEHMRSRIDAFVRDGKLIPSRDGAPVLDQPVHSEQLRVYLNAEIAQVGLHMFLEDAIMELRSETHAEGASLAVQITHTPRFVVRGAVLGVLPAGMLDWFVPGDIEGLARKMMDVTMKGNGGRGVTLALRFERPEAQLATVDGAAAFEILDTALIRFGMKIAADRVMPDEDAERDIARLTRAYRDAVRADVERFARFGRLNE